MELLRLGAVGEERPYVRATDGTVYDLSSVTADIDGAFLASDGIARARAALEAGSAAGRRRRRPAGRRPDRQARAPWSASARTTPPTRPSPAPSRRSSRSSSSSTRTPSSARTTTCWSRADSRKTDWEVELAVVIGKTARYLTSDEEALACVAGYAVSNDVSERAFQLEVSGGQWSKGKCCETFNPLGPALVPADEVGDPQALDLKSLVNGEPRQDSNTRDMIFSVAALIRDLSQYMTLDPGDIVNTGTPEGVALSGRFPYLAPGDVVECEIQGLGRQRQELRQA